MYFHIIGTVSPSRYTSETSGEPSDGGSSYANSMLVSARTLEGKLTECNVQSK